MDRHQRRRPTPVAESPNADPERINVRVMPHDVIDGLYVIGSLARSIEKPITRRFAHTALVVADDIYSVADEEWDDETHFSRFWIIAVNEDHRRTGPFACIVKRGPEPPGRRF